MNIFKNLLTKIGLNEPVSVLERESYRIYRYDGNAEDQVDAYCSRCKENHILSSAQWYIIRKNKKFNMVCLDSLTFEEIKAVLKTNFENSKTTTEGYVKNG